MLSFCLILHLICHSVVGSSNHEYNTCARCGKLKIVKAKKAKRHEDQDHRVKREVLAKIDNKRGGNGLHFGVGDITGLLEKVRSRYKNIPHFRVKFHVQIKHRENGGDSTARPRLKDEFPEDVHDYESLFDDGFGPSAERVTYEDTNATVEEFIKDFSNHKSLHVLPWQRFVINEELDHFCPSVVVNERFLLASKSCIDTFLVEEMSSLYCTHFFPNDFFRRKWNYLRKNRIDSVQLAATHPVKKYKKMPDGMIVHDLVVLEAENSLFLKSQTPVPLCLPSSKNANTSLAGQHFVQFFWLEKPNRADTAIAVNTLVLPDNDSRCLRQKPQENKDTFCAVLDHMKGSPCPLRGEARASGYLCSYNPDNQRLALVGLLSYGETLCKQSDSDYDSGQSEVAVFTRIDQYLKFVVGASEKGECK